MTPDIDSNEIGDGRFLTGQGNYTDDINIRGQAHAYFLRSDVAVGTINGIETTAAAAMPGVVRIFTATGFEGVGGLPCSWQVTDRADNPMQEPRHPILANGFVRHVGDPIVAVVAETLEQTRDAAAAIDMKAALEASSPKVHSDLASNLCYDWGFVEENREAVDRAGGNAAHVTTLELVNNRLIVNAMEPRVAVGGSAMVRATKKIIAKAKKIAAHLLEASDADIKLKDGAFSVAGTDKSVAWGDVTLAAYVPHNYPLEEIEPGLEETAFYDPANFTYPAGAYVCEVEVDPDTGKVDVLAFTAADGFGNVINPMIVEGQVHGGVAQGVSL